MSVPLDKKITVIFRIEPGCLGPEGKRHIDNFCAHATNHLSGNGPEFIHWQLEPRHDKTLPELAYALQQRPLSRQHASRYLAFFGEGIDTFESHLINKLPELIDQYFGR